MLKLTISESYNENLPESLKPSCSLIVELRQSISFFFLWQIFFDLTDIRYLVLLICVIRTKEKGEKELWQIHFTETFAL